MGRSSEMNLVALPPLYFPGKPAPAAPAFLRAGTLVAQGADRGEPGGGATPEGGRQRPLSVSHTGRLEGQQCCLSLQQVALGMGQQPQVKQKPENSLGVRGWEGGKEGGGRGAGG